MSDTKTVTLTEFLLARIAEDEAAAEAARALQDHGEDRWWVDGPAERSGKWWVYATGEKFNHEATATHIARHDPARVLADCEAKRRIVDYRDRVARESAETGVPIFEAQISAYDATLRALALPYADHPEFREEWRP